MEKPQNKYIAVTYRLYTVENNESELIEETSQDRPFLFISGFGVTLESFEKHIAGLEKARTSISLLQKTRPTVTMNRGAYSIWNAECSASTVISTTNTYSKML